VSVRPGAVSPPGTRSPRRYRRGMWGEPVGPLPATVYRRRRAAAAGVLAAGLLGVAVLTFTGDAEEPVEEPLAAVERAEQPVPESGPQPGPGSAAPPPVVEAPECTKEMVAIRAELEPPETRVGQSTTLRLVVTNVGAQPCVRDLDAGRQEVMVVTDDLKGRVWSSNDCENPSREDRRTLQPNQPLGFRLVWNGRTSNPGCTEQRTVVPEGQYKLVTRLDDLQSEPVALRRVP
jgi:hypothetical protein